MSDGVTNEQAPEVQPEQNAEAPAEKKDSVQYETYRRTVGEAKKAKEKARDLEARLAEFEAKEKEREEKELADQQNWKQLLENREAELAKANERLNHLEGSVSNAIKRDYFLSALNGNVPKEYHGLIPLDKIALDPETRQVDEMSLNSALEEFRKVHHRIIDTSDVSKLPNKAPNGKASGTLDPKGNFNDLSPQEQARRLAEEFVGK